MQAMEMSAGCSPQMAGRKKHTAGGLVRRGRPKGGRRAADGWLLTARKRPGQGRGRVFFCRYIEFVSVQ